MRGQDFEPKLNVVSGGPAKSDLWMQMHADVSNVPISFTRVSDGPVLGSAMLAAIGAGIYPDIPAAAENMVHTADTIEPDPGRHEEYRFYVDRYMEAYPQMKSRCTKRSAMSPAGDPGGALRPWRLRRGWLVPTFGRSMTTVSVLGSGVMATALAFPLTDNGHEVRLIGTHLDREIIDSIKETGVHPGLDLEVPRAAKAFQLEEAEEAFDGADVIMSGVNSFGVRWAGGQLFAAPARHARSLHRQGDGGHRERRPAHPPEVLAGEVPEDLREQVSWSAIAGPSIAGEVAVRRDTCVVFTGRDAGVLEEMAGLFRTPYYHVDLDRLRRRRGVRCGQELLRSRGRLHGGHTRP